jgi:hypothetical protein
MTTLDDVAKKKQAEQSAEAQAAVELVRLAQEQELSLTGPHGLLRQLTKTVLETALNEKMTEHLGYETNDGSCPHSRSRPGVARGEAHFRSERASLSGDGSRRNPALSLAVRQKHSAGPSCLSRLQSCGSGLATAAAER